MVNEKDSINNNFQTGRKRNLTKPQTIQHKSTKGMNSTNFRHGMNWGNATFETSTKH
jgi:phage-related protein